MGERDRARAKPPTVRKTVGGRICLI